MRLFEKPETGVPLVDITGPCAVPDCPPRSPVPGLPWFTNRLFVRPLASVLLVVELVDPVSDSFCKPTILEPGWPCCTTMMFCLWPEDSVWFVEALADAWDVD